MKIYTGGLKNADTARLDLLPLAVTPSYFLRSLGERAFRSKGAGKIKVSSTKSEV